MAVELERVRRIELFSSFTEAQLADLAERIEVRDAPTGTQLSHEGGGGYFFFVIETGRATVTREGDTLAELGPGDFFGEAAVLRTRRRTATVTALEPMTLLVIFGADFATFTAEVPDFGAVIDQVLAERLPH
jgi:CRP-like cAMP-binding protein